MLANMTNRTEETKSKIVNVLRMRKPAGIAMRVLAGTALTALLVFAGSFETIGNVGENAVNDTYVIEAGPGFAGIPLPKVWEKIYDDKGKFVGCMKKSKNNCVVFGLAGGGNLTVSSEGVNIQ